LRQYDALLEERPEVDGDNGMTLKAVSHYDRSLNYQKEEIHVPGRDGGIAGVPARAAPAGGDGAVRGGGSAGDGGVVGLCGLPGGAVATRVPAAAPAPGGTALEGIEAAAGEELAGAGSEALAGEGGAAVARAGERRL